jgi:hypothetical protein
MKNMKINWVMVFLVSISILPFETQANNYMRKAESPETIAFQKGRKTKDGRFKRKKGFMWGLFKSKKECDCPKH